MKRTHFLRNFIILVSIMFFNLSYYTYCKAEENIQYKLQKIVKIVSNSAGTLHLTEDGTVMTSYDQDYVKLEGFIQIADSLLTDVKDIVTTNDAFAALKNDGSVVTWGFKECGGDPNYSDENTVAVNGKLENIKNIYTASLANVFIALKDDGTILSWGNKKLGADPTYTDKNTASANGKLVDIVSIATTTFGAFAALKEDGTVVSWGPKMAGGDPTYLDVKTAAKNAELEDIVGIYSTTFGAFAALKSNGSVVTWGSFIAGGSPDYNDNEVVATSRDLENIERIFSNDRAFQAITKDGSSISWGNKEDVNLLEKQYNNWF